MHRPILDETALLATRSEFPTLTKGVHLISHSLGAMPRQARAYATQFLDEWENESINSWHEWLPAVRSLGRPHRARPRRRRGHGRDAAERVDHPGRRRELLHVRREERLRRANKIVYDDLNFSTVHYVWQEQQRRGAELCLVKSRDGIHPPIEELLDAIDERTLLVPISHVLFRSSAMYDAKRVIDRAHEMGAMVLLDCYQSAGTVPLALKEWNSTWRAAAR